MTKSGRTAVLLLSSAIFVVLAALPLLATAETPAPEGETPATEDTTVVTTDIEPAVPTTVDATEPPLDDWTYRYLVPTGIALALLIIIATTGQYFTNVVRKRYRIVEE